MRKKINNETKELKRKGFTLVELLVTSAIFIAIGTILVTILSTSFKINQRTELTLLLKNSGSNALSQMVNTIKYASSLDDPLTCVTADGSPVVQNSISFTSSFDGGHTMLSCPTNDSPAIASNGASLIDSNVFIASNCTFSCSQISTTQPPTITINFSLSVVNSANSSGTLVTIPFHTAVTLRNFIR